MMDEGDRVLDFLRAEGFLAEDGGLLFIGRTAEEEFGRRYFMELLSAFTSAWEMRVIAGTHEIGTVSPMSVTSGNQNEAKEILLAGRAWLVESIDWERHEILVSEQSRKGKVRWPSEPIAESFELSRAQRDVLLGATPEVDVSRRADRRLGMLREEMRLTVDGRGLVRLDQGESSELWTWAGWRANETLIAALGVDATADNACIHLDELVTAPRIRDADVDTAIPVVSPQALAGLKFSAALPPELAAATLADRIVDRAGARSITSWPLVVRTEGETQVLE